MSLVFQCGAISLGGTLNHLGSQSDHWSEALSLYVVVVHDLGEERSKENLGSVISANV